MPERIALSRSRFWVVVQRASSGVREDAIWQGSGGADAPASLAGAALAAELGGAADASLPSPLGVGVARRHPADTTRSVSPIVTPRRSLEPRRCTVTHPTRRATTRKCVLSA